MRIKKVTSIFMFALMLCGVVFAQATQQTFEEPTKSISSHKEDVTLLMLTPDKSKIVSASRDKEIKFYRADNGNETKTISGNGSAVLSVALSKDGKLLFSGCGDGSAALWNIETGSLIQRFRNHNAPVVAVAISPDPAAKYLYSSGEDANIQVYDRLQNNKFIKTIQVEGAFANCMKFDAKGKNLILGCNDGKVRILDPATGKFLNTFDGHAREITGLVLSPDGKYFATSSNDNTVKYWDATTGAVVKTFEGHEWKVYGVDISADGKYLASGSNDGTLRIWDINAGNNIKTIKLKNKRTFYAVLFSPDMKSVISGMQIKSATTPAIMWWNTGL